MKLNPKVFFGALASFFILALAVIVILNLPKTRTSSAEINLQHDNFKLSLDINKLDERVFEEFLSNFNLNQKLKEYEFQTDSTASAALAFATPIKADLKINSKQISFIGNTDISFKINSEPKQIKLSKSTIASVSGENLTYFLKSNPNLKNQTILDEIPNWQYLVLLNEKDFIFIFKSEDDFFQKIIDQFKKEKEYVVENDEDVTFHMFKDQKNDQSTIVLFQSNGLSYLSSSKEAAKEQISADGKEFPENQQDSFTFEYNNQDNERSPEAMLKLFQITNSHLDGQTLRSSILKISKLSFSLNGRTFSGLISLK